ncbi:hypothetical protein NKJ55_06990 [Mesorhizobium sp. M0106]|uniref:hypothetical protein n=1 Tax=Mesorhizobium sp. M0106 TaxID=2956880 RepID=UPI00333AC604
MTVAVGDIVALSVAGSGQLRWVVSGFLSNPSGRREAKLVRKNMYGTYSSYQRNTEGLIPIETPVFNSGDKVWVDGNRGEYMSRDGDIARVMLAPRRRQFTGVGFIEIRPAVATVSYHLLVVENRKV